jgi:hypothetical protein
MPACRARVDKYFGIVILPNGVRGDGLVSGVSARIRGTLRRGLDSVLYERHRVPAAVHNKRETSVKLAERFLVD